MYLVDTHVALWATSSDPRLSRAQAEVLAGAGPFFFSIVSLWEIAIKRGLGKLEIAADFRADMATRNVTVLPLALDHIDRLTDLPPHHRDPFDRMLVAQALCEGLVILSSDPSFRAYGVGLVA